MAIDYNYFKKKKERESRSNITKGVASLSNPYSQNFDPNTKEGLINLAIQEGGMTAEVVNELVHPKKSILSGMGSVLKNAGKGFIDAISFTGEVTAGVLLGMKDDELSISEGVRKALKEDITASDVLLGDYNKTGKTGLQKVGNFAVRFAIDTLLDPLTYISFGAVRGVLGLSAAPKFRAGTKLSQELGIKGIKAKGGKLVALSEKTGDDMMLLMNQSLKGESTEAVTKRLIKNGISKETLETSVKEALKDASKFLDSKTISVDKAREAMTRLLEINPKLHETLLDKGGIKLFGRTILEAEKIKYIKNYIPLAKPIDRATEPLRLALNSMFDPKIQKIQGSGGYKGYRYTPQEFINFGREKDQLIKRSGEELFSKFEGSARAAGVKTADEFSAIINAALQGKPGMSKRHLKLYERINDIVNIESKLALKARGINIVNMPQKIPKIIMKEESANVVKNVKSTYLNTTVDAAKEKKNVTFEFVNKNLDPVIGTKAEKTLEQVDIKNIKKELDANLNKNIELAGGIDSEFIKSEIEKGKTIIKNIKNAIDNKILTLTKQTDDLMLREPDGFLDVVDDINRQKKSIKAGDTKDIFVDKKTGDVAFRRSSTYSEIEEQIGIKGYQMKDIDWAVSTQVDTFNSMKQGIGASFTEDISRFGVRASEAPSHFVPLPEGTLGVNLALDNTEELLFDPSVAEGILGMLDATKKTYNPSAFLKAYDSVTNIWKVSVTSIFPAFHARNGLSNCLLNFADIGYHVFDPRKWTTSGDLIRKNFKYEKLVKLRDGAEYGSNKFLKIKDEIEELLNTNVFKDKTKNSQTWTFGQMRDIIVDKGVAFTKRTRNIKQDLIDQETGKAVASFFTTKKEKILRKTMPVTTDFFPFDLGLKVGGVVEDHGRILNFITNLEKTGDVTLAATRTKQFLFDYTNLTDFEKNVMRRIVPFYSFSRFNIELQAKALMTTPGRTAQQIRAFETFNNVFSQEELTKEQEDLLPGYMKRGFMSLRKSKEGTLKLISGFEATALQPFEILSKKGILGSISPLVRMPLEQLTGYDMYQSKMFSDATNASAYKYFPKPIKDFIGYKEIEFTHPDTGKKVKWSVSLRPNRMNLVNNLPPTSRVISSIRNVSNDNKTISEKAMRELFGINVFDVDFEKLEQRREDKMMEEIANKLDTSNVIYSFKKNIISK